MQVAIIGAGPRGLTVAERLINLANDDTQIDVQIYDPHAIGGRVWDPFLSQNRSFLMNTVIDQITLFNDESIENGGKPLPGPNMFQWLESEAKDFLSHHQEFDASYTNELSRLTQVGDFATRGMMGIYAAWFFEWLMRRVRHNQTLNFTQQSVMNVQKLGEKFQLMLNDGTQLLADHVVMALGHSDDNLTDEEQGFKTFAQNKGLHYLSPMHPAEADLSVFNENDKIIIRGLGLSFFDYMTALSVGKGGRFIRDENDNLIYKPSGHEPLVVAGSRRGFPLHARGVNEKSASELYEPKFFTIAALEALRAAGNGHIQYQDFENLVVKEMTYKYLLNRINQPDSSLTYDQSEALKQALLTSIDIKTTAEEYGLADVFEFDIALIRNPARDLPNDADYTTWMQSYLSADIHDARLGNKSAPFAGAFDILRDIRDRVRYIVERDYFTADDYEKFLEHFKPFDALVSVGPPLERIEQLLALMKAGLFKITAANIHVTTDATGFEASDSRGQLFHGNALVEARLGATNISLSRNPLIANLRDNGMFVQPRKIRSDGTSYQLGAANINKQTFEVINRDGETINHLYLYGITLEGLKWFGTVIPRPGVNTLVLREGAWIAQRILAYA
ncbi:FAD/NAD(P)-binding protein [Leuconostoc citreum]|uniref:FAD/NAD(P)-binding protein n=1 Tax=Leuconostoc citreum TaxID=33964 RepID=UPI00054220CC|nr:FAD/NAD(P)-binding protein [Leuconostoc citreum]CDX65611.1 Dehydrogenase (Flavoprotein) [Leuconostoc citreum]